MVSTSGDRGPMPKSLMEAHLLLSHMRPAVGAPREKWLAFYRRSAQVYLEMAEIDRGHHHEAMYWAARERAKANKLQAEIDQDPAPAGGPKPKKGVVGPATVDNEL